MAAAIDSGCRQMNGGGGIPVAAIPARDGMRHAQPGGAPPGAGIRSAARQVYMNAVRGGPMDGLGKYSEEGNKIAAERLRKLIDYHISKLSDEDKEWVDKVMAMNEEDARRAISQRRVQRLFEEGNRRDYEHFLGQIP